MDALQAILSRKSVRSYQTRPVESEKLELLLKSANKAPKAGEMHITVVENNTLLSEINHKTLNAMKSSGNDFLVSRANLPGYQPLYGAPMLILFSVQQTNPFGQATASCAAANTAIAATALGLGSCYVVSPIPTICREHAIAEKLKIPEGYSPACGIIIGYKDSDKFSTPEQKTDNINYCR